MAAEAGNEGPGVMEDHLNTSPPQKEKGATEDEMVGWHHQLNGHEFEQAPGDGERRVSLLCGTSWSRRVGHDFETEQQLYY